MQLNIEWILTIFNSKLLVPPVLNILHKELAKTIHMFKICEEVSKCFRQI
jgi:hypothetical protein